MIKIILIEHLFYIVIIGILTILLYLCRTNICNMAICIKPVPTLHGRVAAKFDSMATHNESKRATVDFTRQVRIARAILEKSKLKR